MKFQDIQEARHHTDHPIVEWIKKFVETSKVHDHKTYRLISEKHAKQAAQAITREYGDQITVDEWPVTEWNIDVTKEQVVFVLVDYKNLEVDVRRLKWNH